MPDIAVVIPSLPPANLPLSGPELIVVEQGGVTKQTQVINARGPAPTLYVTGNNIGINGSNQVAIPGAAVAEVVTVAGVGTLAVDASKFVEVFVVIGGVGSSSVKIGTSVGGAEIVPLTAISSGEILTFRVDYFMLSAGTIHFTGAGLTIKNYIR